MRFLHMFWSMDEALGEDFKYTWVRVKPNSTITFMSDIKMNKMKRAIVILACLKCKYVMLEPCRNHCLPDGGKSILVPHRLSILLICRGKYLATVRR